MDGRILRCGIISSCQSAATLEIVSAPEHVFIVEQRYIKYLTFTFIPLLLSLQQPKSISDNNAQ